MNDRDPRATPPCDPCRPQASPAGRRPSMPRKPFSRSVAPLHSAASPPPRGCRSLHHYPKAPAAERTREGDRDEYP